MKTHAHTPTRPHAHTPTRPHATEDNITLDLTGHTKGLYSIILVCNGEIQDTKNLIKQ